MKMITLTGWAQKADSMAFLAPDGAEVTCLDYGSHITYAAFCDANPQGDEADVLVAWSLGSQLAIRLVAEGKVRAKRLVLLAPPYQLLADKHFPKGVKPLVVKASRMALVMNPYLMLKQFRGVSMAMGDDNAKEVIAQAKLALADKNYHFVEWFDTLSGFSCASLNFAAFPPTTIIHGRGDAIIPFANGEKLAECIPQAELIAVEKCGHAPHWHDAKSVKAVINGL